MKFFVTGVDASTGKERTLELCAESEVEAVAAAKQSGVLPCQVQTEQPAAAKQNGQRFALFGFAAMFGLLALWLGTAATQSNQSERRNQPSHSGTQSYWENPGTRPRSEYPSEYGQSERHREAYDRYLSPEAVKRSREIWDYASENPGKYLTPQDKAILREGGYDY